jgi:aminoglycoside phosphotransferase (APT) family kinase protein
MTGGERTREPPPLEVVRIARDEFGVSLEDAQDAWRGEESVGWRGSSAEGPRFVQRLPVWRDVGELGWCDSVAEAAATAAPACVRAVRSRDGRSVVVTSEGPLMVFPFVEGTHPDVDEDTALQAAEVLAAMHRGIATGWSGPPKPRRRPGPAPGVGRRELLDEGLDRWERSLEGRFTRVPVHGDFYPGNLLVDDGRVAGVIDWSEADVDYWEQEVAWAAWEFGHSDSGDDLDDARAEAFMQAYLASGGPASVAAPFDPLPWIRRRLRNEARTWFGDPRSVDARSAYHEAEVRALASLRSRRLPGR